MTQIIIYYAIAVVFTIFGFVLAGIMSSGKEDDIKTRYYYLGKKEGKKQGYKKAYKEFAGMVDYKGDSVHWEEYE